MSATILTEQQQKVLELLAPIVEEKNFYLAGGTALAIQLHHRRSIDFDFFTDQSFNPSLLLAQLPPSNVLQEAAGTLTVLLDGVKVSFFSFPYPLLSVLKKSEKISLADITDIAAMKISAIAGRGSRKDFIDLFCIATMKYSLAECLTMFEKKFSAHTTDRYHLLRSVTYFADAEEEVMPEMLIEFDWERTKTFFIEEVKKLQ